MPLSSIASRKLRRRPGHPRRAESESCLTRPEDAQHCQALPMCGAAGVASMFLGRISSAQDGPASVPTRCRGGGDGWLKQRRRRIRGSAPPAGCAADSDNVREHGDSVSRVTGAQTTPAFVELVAGSLPWRPGGLRSPRRSCGFEAAAVSSTCGANVPAVLECQRYARSGCAPSIQESCTRAQARRPRTRAKGRLHARWDDAQRAKRVHRARRPRFALDQS